MNAVASDAPMVPARTTPRRVAETEIGSCEVRAFDVRVFDARLWPANMRAAKGRADGDVIEPAVRRNGQWRASKVDAERRLARVRPGC